MLTEAKKAPKVLPVPPRTVESRGVVARVILKIVSVVTAIFASCCVGYFALALMWGIAGVETRGVVADVHVEKGSRITQDYFDYQYETPAGKFKDQQSVSHEAWEFMQRRLKAGSGEVAVAVRYYHLGPFRIAALPEYVTVWWEVTKTGLFAWLFAILAVVLFRAAWRSPSRERWLLQHGLVAAGAISGKRTEQGRFKMWLIAYEYEGASGQRWREEAQTSRKIWEKSRVGDVVTVLVDPHNEDKSLVYEWSPVKVKE